MERVATLGRPIVREVVLRKPEKPRFDAEGNEVDGSFVVCVYNVTTSTLTSGGKENIQKRPISRILNGYTLSEAKADEMFQPGTRLHPSEGIVVKVPRDDVRKYNTYSSTEKGKKIEIDVDAEYEIMHPLVVEQYESRNQSIDAIRRKNRSQLEGNSAGEVGVELPQGFSNA